MRHVVVAGSQALHAAAIAIHDVERRVQVIARRVRIQTPIVHGADKQNLAPIRRPRRVAFKSQVRRQVRGPEPSPFMTQMSPLRTKANVPSGAHAGSVSNPGWLVRLTAPLPSAFMT